MYATRDNAPDNLRMAAVTTAAAGFFGTVIAHAFWEKKFEKARQNYNLSIMGIPIPTGKKR